MGKTRGLRRVLCLTLAVTVLLANLSVPTYAFASSGLGTEEQPYRVATCEDIQDIQDDLDAHYIQTQNIDCSDTVNWNGGEGFVPIGQGDDFSGVYDGQNFTITDIFIDQPDTDEVGLFLTPDGATIKNIHLVGGSMDSEAPGYNGSLAARAYDTTFSDCSSTVAMHSVAQAGLVGAYLGGTMSRCWYDGDISADDNGYTAGLVAVASDVSFNDVYTKGSLLGETYSGGLIGSITGGSITNAYSSMNVTSTADTYSGGLIGSISAGFNPEDEITISNVFFAGTFSESASNAGAISGPIGPGTVFNGVYYDQDTCACATALGSGSPDSGSVTAVNADGLSADYFKGNSTSPPLNNWNFTSTWQVNTNDFPVLRVAANPTDSDDDGINDADENAAPNSGDANDDGFPDAAQANVASYLNPVTGEYSVLVTDCGVVTNVQVGAESSGDPDSDYEYPAGLVAFWVYCANPGDTAFISQYNYGIVGNENYSVRKWDNEYKTIPGATLEGQLIDGEVVFKVSYQITDGGEFDSDGIENGIIIDPAGPALFVAQANQSQNSSSRNSTGALAETGSSTTVLLSYVTALIGLSFLGFVSKRFLQ